MPLQARVQAAAKKRVVEFPVPFGFISKRSRSFGGSLDKSGDPMVSPSICSNARSKRASRRRSWTIACGNRLRRVMGVDVRRGAMPTASAVAQTDERHAYAKPWAWHPQGNVIDGGPDMPRTSASRPDSAHGTPPKTIEEFIGRANSRRQRQHRQMDQPAGMERTGADLEFEVLTVVLRGSLRVETKEGVHDVAGRRSDLVAAEWKATARWERKGTAYRRAPAAGDGIVRILVRFSPTSTCLKRPSRSDAGDFASDSDSARKSSTCLSCRSEALIEPHGFPRLLARTDHAAASSDRPARRRTPASPPSTWPHS